MINKILKFTSSFFIILLLFVISFMIALTGAHIYKNPSIVKSGVSKLPHFYIISSGSMEPALKVGSLVVSMPSDTYDPGEVITFQRNGPDDLITHRIEFKTYEDGVHEEPTFITSGDANEDIDQWKVNKADIIGKVILSVPYAGYAADFAKTPKGFILLVIVPATIVVYEEFRSLLAELRRRLRKVKSNEVKSDTHNDQKSRTKIPGISFIPFIGGAVVVVGLTSGFLFDAEKSTGNVFGAASSFDQTISLENKYASNYENDNTKGSLTYNPIGPTFDYSFEATGLNNQEYCLIYFADGWAGNHPGALIDRGTPNPDGTLNLNGSFDLGFSLPTKPDENIDTGAKIWLVYCSNYNTSTHALTAWNPVPWLFEENTVWYERTVPTPTVDPTPTSSEEPSSPSALNQEDVTINLANIGADPQYGYVYDYSGANVSFTYNNPSDDVLEGTLTASGLKPYFTYQLKFEALPTCLDATNGDDELNERLGLIGRWWDNTTNQNLNSSASANDAYYFANSDYHGGSECISGYLVWGYITADSSGDVTKSVKTDTSYHVLWCGGGTCDSATNTPLLSSGIDPDHSSVMLCDAPNVDGELERSTCGGSIVTPGHYKLRMILNEESFHQGNWTAVMDSPIEFDILPDHLVINELLPNPDTTFTDEWVEIYNPTNSPYDLTGWTLKDLALPSRDLTSLGTINAYDYVVFVDPSDNWINNGSETLDLVDPSSTVIDSYSYSSAAGDTSFGRDPDGTEGFNVCTTASKGTSNNGLCQ